MNRRLVYVENARVLADSGEITTPILTRDPITSLTVELRATNGATNNVDQSLADCLTNISILDGSEVLYSLSGHELMAYTAYKLGYLPYQLVTEMPGLQQNCFAVIQFGRWFGDQVFAFDPSKFNNPQIRLQWNLAAVRAVGATGFVSGTGRIEYIADVMEGAAAPQGMLCAKRENTFTTAASGDVSIDLPVDRLIKAMYLRSRENGTGSLSGLSNVKLSADQDKFIPLDMATSDLKRQVTLRNKEFHYKHGFHKADASTIYLLLSHEESLSLVRDDGDSTLTYLNNGIGEGELGVMTAGAADANPRTIWASVHGFLPFNTLMLEQGEYDDPESWLQATMFKNLRAILTQSNAGATCSLVLETAKVY
jgi:hypothetical protein